MTATPPTPLVAAGAVSLSATSSDGLRNLALVGQAGAGKTSLAEALLRAAGVRDVVSDFTDEEREHGHSLFTSLLHLDHGGCSVNLLDTPGASDFLGQAMSALPAVETVAVVVNAARGVEPMTRRMMKRAGERKLCRMIVVNRIDQLADGGGGSGGMDLAGVLEGLRETFGGGVLPVNLPSDGASRVVGCFSGTAGESDLGPVSDWHQRIVDQVVEVDEALMETYLEQGHVNPDQLHAPFEQALREGHLVPVVFTASGEANEVGVSELLKFICELAPSPAEGNPRPFVRGHDEDPAHEVHAVPDAAAHVLAHVFAVRVDPFRGKLAIFRVHQGTVTKDTQLFVDDAHRGESRKAVRVGHLFRINGEHCVEVDRAVPGDLCAVSKLDEVHFDAVLHDHHDEDDVHLKPLRLPEPMAGVAITPTKRGDEQKLADALAKMQDEDPTVKVSRDATTHETVLRGLGDLHLRVMLEKLEHRHHVSVETKPPTVAYRETIRGSAEGQHRHKKQTGGAGQFGEVKLLVEPLERGEGFEFVDDTFGGSIPKPLIPAIEKGVRSALADGVVAGFPLQDLRVRVLDGKHHPVDSKEIAFVTAGKRAFLEAVSRAKPVLLEPMVEAEVVVPASYLGDVTADVSTRRGRITGTDFLAGEMVALHAVVPLESMTTYSNQLRAMTGGAGSFSMELSHYEPASHEVQQRVSAAYSAQHDEA